ncbi:uncharacterized protein LOC144114718 isoform X2 [Amblyomma americanum]
MAGRRIGRAVVLRAHLPVETFSDSSRRWARPQQVPHITNVRCSATVRAPVRYWQIFGTPPMTERWCQSRPCPNPSHGYLLLPRYHPHPGPGASESSTCRDRRPCAPDSPRPAVPHPAGPEPTSPLTPAPSPALTTRHVDMTTPWRPETPLTLEGLQQPTLHGAAFSGPRHLFSIPATWPKIVPTIQHLGLQAESH